MNKVALYMPSSRIIQNHPTGIAPATLTPRKDGKAPVISLIQYDANDYDEKKIEKIEDVFHCRDDGKICWINIDGLGDVEMLGKLGEHFGLHPLALEDVLHAPQRPKFEEYDSHFFMIAQMVYSNGDHEIEFEQISIFFSPKFVITIQEDPSRDIFGPLRVRLRHGRGFARTRGHDYLAYALMDSVVDEFFPVLEPIGESIEALEDELLERPTRQCIMKLHDMKRVLLQLRRNAWPIREVVSALSRDESGLITKETKIFLRDCYDHTIQIMDVIESYRDLTSGMMDIYLSSLGMRTNEVMRVLTVVTTIFVPLTFIAGLYGMNFEVMPELKWKYGYPACLLLMVVLASGMLALFRRNKWL